MDCSSREQNSHSHQSIYDRFRMAVEVQVLNLADYADNDANASFDRILAPIHIFRDIDESYCCALA